MKHVLSARGREWVNIQSPTAEELAEFVRMSELRPDDAEYVAHSLRHLGITVRPHYVLILIQVPVFDRTLRVTEGVSLFIVVRQNTLFTLHHEPIVGLDRMRQDIEGSVNRQDEYFGNSSAHLGLAIISRLYEDAFRKLDKLSKHIEIAEDAVFQGNERKMVEEISFLTRDVMDFRNVIRAQTNLFTSMPEHSLLDPDTGMQWRRVHEQLLKMWDILEGLFESAKELSSTNFTLLQHKENELLRLLTVYSIIVIPMLVLTDPFFDPRAPDATLVDDLVFWIVIGVLVISLVGILSRFRRR